MGLCHTCGNEYKNSFDVLFNNQKFTFDSFECAITTLAPVCNHCECRVIGHGVESHGVIYCCAHCAHACGVDDVQDRSQKDMDRTSNVKAE